VEALALWTAQIACLPAESSFGTSVLLQHDYPIKYIVSKRFKTKFVMYKGKNMLHYAHFWYNETFLEI
jgi:hypothetical protein